MPEYLAPGVFVEEVSYRAKSIEGVSTTTTGFVGPTRFGPTDLEPEVITSLVEFERVYGGRGKLVWNGTEIDNYMWNAARAFFEEGGKRLYVSRVYKRDGSNVGAATRTAVNNLKFSARFPGVAGNGRLTLQFALGQNRLVIDGSNKSLKGLGDGDIVYVSFDPPPVEPPASPPAAPAGLVGFYLLVWDGPANAWKLTQPAIAADPAATPPVAAVPAKSMPLTDGAISANVRIRRVSVSVFYEPAATDLPTFAQVELALDNRHTSNGTPDSLLKVFARDLPSDGMARTTPIVIERDGVSADPTGLDLIAAFTTTGSSATASKIRLADLIADAADPAKTSLTFILDNGRDGVAPDANTYIGAEDVATNRRTGLKTFENVEDISIVAAPGSSATATDAQGVANALIAHAQTMRYRIAIIDSIKGQSIADVRAYRGKFDSKYAAFYYPWVRIIDPVTNQENHYPPSGFVAGIFARNDIERAVYKAPANEVVNLAIGFEKFLNKGQQEVLNPEGVNCFRFFEGRGMRLWGARTMTSDPEWKYVNLRRYFAYLERSIDKGTQWAVFEPNGEKLWANVRRTIEDFLLNEWQNGALLGDKPEKSYFVKCDRSTMTQNDLDNGRLICQVGVAPLRPAEFVIFRVGQWTADRKA
ncbi:phage tail sheath subtilisin-like domain-containing protein [Erythrobacter oryzae]|uniref:phage tail sheath subtilisin-like domain-containing protein n=1 Tax=Erythrobacter oryzae TaxID=3019556 RepID=UPI002556DC76|nr:phage tail sheath subtilisin-like domain-containing protein [Erythrobacter sp. COR-2]